MGSLAERHHPADVQPQILSDRIPVMAPSRKGAEDAAAQKLRTESSMACARYSARAELRPAIEMRPSFVMYLRGAEVCVGRFTVVFGPSMFRRALWRSCMTGRCRVAQ